MIGALVFGPLADRIGRKRIIILSTLAFGDMRAGHGLRARPSTSLARDYGF